MGKSKILEIEEQPVISDLGTSKILSTTEPSRFNIR